MRRDLNIEDLETILYWHRLANKKTSNKNEIPNKTLIKIQAMAIYAQEDNERFPYLFKRKKKWDAKSAQFLIRILVVFNYGKMFKCVDYAVVFVTIFHGMVIICMNIGEMEIEWIPLSKMWWWRYCTSFW